jgi:transcriptional regulator of acetoin/glycerol metabolism
VAVNCAAIPEALIESELFGYLPGSFSGASAKGKRGLVQEADGGTLFLDEIGDMPLALQARLLRVLSEREVLPVGATRAVPVNIRVIAATHAPLETLVREGRFRDDLYYRLNGAQIQLPPLRQRSDLTAMIGRLLGGRTLLPEARARLLAHPWPGNLRELRNVLEFATSVCPEGPIGLDDLPELGPASTVRTPGPTAGPQREADLHQALRAAQWNVSEVARRMGLSRMTLYRRMKRAGIVPPNRMP